MTRIENLLEHLVAAVSDRGAGTSSDVAVVVTSLDLDLPVEARLANDGSVLATLPRGLLATGFEMPVSRLRVRCRELDG